MFRNHTRRIAATLVLLSTTVIPQTAFAASYLNATKKPAKTTFTASLVDMTQSDRLHTTHTLDWRQPSVDLMFELPPSQRTSEIILNLSADPLTRVAPNAPLQVQFNDGPAVPVLSNGNGFEARIPLDAVKVRGSRNVLRISYPAPPGAECVTPAHGAWSIDLAQSSLRVSGRARNRNMSLSEITEYLEHAALAPKTVGLIARGADATDMQALAAQGLSLRTPDVPKFSVSKQGTDFNIVMVKRNRLLDITSDPMILNSKGARIFIPRGKPSEIIFTADTDAEILEMLEIFATRKLPKTQRAISSLGEMNIQRRLDSGRREIDGKTRLSDLTVLSAGSKSGEKSYAFRVADPIATQGELLLRLSTTKNVDKNSRLRVSLNGKVLGATKLDKKRKSVAFSIQPGDLKAASNILTVSPDLAANSAFTCPVFSYFNSGFSIGNGSRLTVTKTANLPATNLAQLTTTGGLFAKSESYIALPRQTRDYQAALSVLGRMAKASGRGFTLADYSRTSNLAKDKNLLIIGPSDMAQNHLAGAPKALKEALSGQASSGSNLLQAKYGQSAAVEGDNSAVQYAAAQSASKRINRGGIAALYRSDKGHLTGVITATPGTNFKQASQNLVKPAHWEALQGSVARWTTNSVVMAQTAQPDATRQTADSKPRFQFLDYDLPALDSANFSFPDIDWPEFDLPTVSMPDLKWPNFNRGSSEPKEQLAQTLQSQSVKDVKTAEFKYLETQTFEANYGDVTPRLKPVSNTASTRSNSLPARLRGPFEYANDTSNHVGTFHGIQRETKAKWSATKQWFKSKVTNIKENRTLNEVSVATDRLQDQTKPAGRTLKAVIMDKLPGQGLVQLGDRTVSVYGLILIMAFGLVLLLMSLAKPASRLGGRH